MTQTTEVIIKNQKNNLIPFVKTINELTDTQSYFVACASYISFVVMTLHASYI